MEVCVDCIESAVYALRGGAKRIELCSALSEGGLTPSIGLLRTIRAQIVAPIFCMIRPRDGDFLYSDLELTIMEEDIQALLKEGANGLVFGCLTKDGQVDEPACSRLISTAKKSKPEVELTFHRAIDLSRDLFESAKAIHKLGFKRILTSGGKQTAEEGKDVIRDLISSYGDSSDLIVFPGGGINPDNLGDLLEHTNAFEFHASARQNQPSKMEYQNPSCSLGSNSSEYSRKVSTVEAVSQLTRIYKEVKLKYIFEKSPERQIS